MRNEVKGKSPFYDGSALCNSWLPEEVEIINVVYDAKREIVEAVIRSDKQITELTYPTDEGHCISSSNSSLAFELIRKAKETKSDETD